VPDNHTIAIEVHQQGAPLLRKLLDEAKVAHDLPVTPEPPEQSTTRSMQSVPPEFVLVMVGAATSASIHALGSVLREYIRSQRTRVRILLDENNMVEIDGNLSPDQIAALIDVGRTDGISPPKPE
jgi:hypothetical protein